MASSITINITQLADKAEETGTIPTEDVETLASELEQDEQEEEEAESFEADDDEEVQEALASRFASKMRRIAREASYQDWDRKRVASELRKALEETSVDIWRAPEAMK